MTALCMIDGWEKEIEIDEAPIKSGILRIPITGPIKFAISKDDLQEENDMTTVTLYLVGQSKNSGKFIFHYR